LFQLNFSSWFVRLLRAHARNECSCVYKLVEIGGIPRIKLSQDVAKVMVPGQKRIYRIFRPSGEPLVRMRAHYKN
jgi:nicotinate phosphoribosyltransferase